jgi:hypothetical protein
MKIKGFVVLLFLLGIVVFTWYKIGSKSYAESDKLLTNHVRFSGTIMSFQKSDNHAYGIIVIKLTDTNTKEFENDTIPGIFPYKVKGEYAEFYGYIPASIKVGNTVLLDSDKRIMNIYDNNTLLTATDVGVSSETENVLFVKQHTMFK